MNSFDNRTAADQCSPCAASNFVELLDYVTSSRVSYLQILQEEYLPDWYVNRNSVSSIAFLQCRSHD